MANKIDSNITALAYAEEQTLGVLPGTPIWRGLEPNSYSNLGPDIKTTPREPITFTRQRIKGTVTDVDATAGFQHDWLSEPMVRLAQSFFFAAAREKADSLPINGTQLAMTATTTTTFTAAAGLGVFKAADLVLASGFTNAANNGVKLLSAAASGSVTTTGLVVEAAPPAAARIQTVGVQFASADVNVSYAAPVFQLTSTVYNFTTLGLIAGEWVFLGDDTAANRFANNSGYCRVKSVAAGAITFDQSTFTPVTEAGTGKTIRMYFGKVLKNESTAALITPRSVQVERQLGSDGVAVQSEYVVGCIGDELKLSMPKTDKLTVDLSYVGLTGEQRTGTQGIKSGTRVAAVSEQAYNSANDIYRAYITVNDATVLNSAALVGYLESCDITIKNNVSAVKALGYLGGFDITAGNFEASGSVSAYFTTMAAVVAVNNNSDIGFNVIASRQNQGFVFDIPLMSITGGQLNVQKDSPVMLPLNNMGFQNANGYTMLYCNFPYLPTVAM